MWGRSKWCKNRKWVTFLSLYVQMPKCQKCEKQVGIISCACILSLSLSLFHHENALQICTECYHRNMGIRRRWFIGKWVFKTCHHNTIEFHQFNLVLWLTLRWIFGPKRDENGEWRRFHNEELHSLYRSPNIVNLEDWDGQGM